MNMDAFLRRVKEQREREQREQEMEALKTRPACERCGEWLLGGRAQLPPGARICGPCEKARKG